MPSTIAGALGLKLIGEISAESVARWFSRPSAQVSAHYCVDVDSIVQCVRERDIAWHARGGNAKSIGIELAGYARQTKAEWADAYSRASRGSSRCRIGASQYGVRHV